MKAIIKEKSLAKHGKSFHFASRIFDGDTIRKVTLLYAFCRYIDDCADNEDPKTGRPKILAVQSILQGKKDTSELSALVDEVVSLGIEKENIFALSQGALFDIDGRKIEDEADLIQYCYLVAGTVGMMMCNLFGVRSKRAHQHAVALGIAMQLTNICRDILEDACAKRTYVPLSMLKTHQLSPNALSAQGPTPKELKVIVDKMITMAERYYELAYEGLAFLPVRIRIAILVAGEVYRSIGRKIRFNDCEVLQGRTMLSTREKLLVTIKALPRLFSPTFWRVPNANNMLESGIASLIQHNTENLHI